MKQLSTYRDADLTQKWVKAIASITTQTWNIMEVCGGQTHSIIKYGIDQLIPETIDLIHGPGCPVCVTPIAYIDKALAIAEQTDVIFCSFGDMLRVPGSANDLLNLKAQGADIRVVYSPMDAISLAQLNPHRQIVFFAVGFETTVPTTALAVYKAQQLRLPNFSLLSCHVRVPPVVSKLFNSPNNRVQGLLGAGHVSSVMGYHEYLPIASQYRIPIVITGFEPVDILQGLFFCIKQLENGQYEVENQYRRVVKLEGNLTAQQLMQKVFVTVDREWRGLGKITGGGLALNGNFSEWDAEQRFNTTSNIFKESSICKIGDILQGLIKPPQCPEFGNRCTPEHPVGATMVSSEGACAAYFRYRSTY